ncbi:MAG: hypothetical protein IPL06_03000 [Betaproteobacteria bacterium]|nr:hypothetical protein [Betaproteobacteria bacterium]
MLQPSDNRIVAVGQVTVDTGTGSRIDYAVARYNTDGTLDTSFDTDGFATGAFVASDDAMNTLASLAVLPGGEIVAGGEVADAVNGTSRMAAVRFTSAGALDGTYGTAGQAVVTTTGLSTTTAMRRQSDGKLLFAGTGDDGVTFGAPTLVRLLENGTPDPAFGTGGAIFTADLQEWTALVLRADDRAVVGAGSSRRSAPRPTCAASPSPAARTALSGSRASRSSPPAPRATSRRRFRCWATGASSSPAACAPYSALQGVLARHRPRARSTARSAPRDSRRRRTPPAPSRSLRTGESSWAPRRARGSSSSATRPTARRTRVTPRRGGQAPPSRARSGTSSTPCSCSPTARSSRAARRAVPTSRDSSSCATTSTARSTRASAAPAR